MYEKGQSFKKYDQDKPEFDIISQFDRELGEVNRVMAYGADKYGMDNWKLCTTEGLRRYRNAAMRHLLDSFRNRLDLDSGQPHYAHIITNLLFIAYLERVNQIDERKPLNACASRLPNCS